MAAISQSKPKGMKKKSFGSIRAKAGLPSKAGRRKGKAINAANWKPTTAEDRAFAKFYSNLQTRCTAAPINNFRITVTPTVHPEIVKLFAKVLRDHTQPTTETTN